MSSIGTAFWSRAGNVTGVIVAVISLALLGVAVGIALGIGVAVTVILIASGPGAVLGGATGTLGSFALIAVLIPFAIIGLVLNLLLLATIVIVVDAGINLVANIIKSIFPALGPPTGPGFFSEIGQRVSRFAGGFRDGAKRVIDRATELGKAILPDFLNPFG